MCWKVLLRAVALSTLFVVFSLPFFSFGDEVTARLAKLEEWRIRWGQKVVIENVRIRTPTDFIVERGGTLVIRNSEIVMLGEHHHDNYIDVNGHLIIENSTLVADPPAAYLNISTDQPSARIEILSSNLPDAHVSLRDGGAIELRDTTLSGLEFYQTQRAMREGAQLVAENCVVKNEFDLRFGDVTGTITIRGLHRGISDYSYKEGRLSVEIRDCVLPIPVIDNRGSGDRGRLRLHIVDCEVSELVSWEGGDIIVEDSTLCSLNIRHYHRGRYEYRGLRPGYFEDAVFLEQPTRTIRLINTTILDCWKPGSRECCPKDASTGVTLVDVDGAVVEDSELCELKVRGDLTAKNVKIGSFQLYENVGTVRFDDCVIESFEVVISTKTHIYGNVQFLTKEIFDWGGWTNFSLTRHYPILVVDEGGDPVPNARVELVNSRGEVENILVTDKQGITEAVLHFTEENLESVWQVRVPSLGISLPLTILTDTPIRTDQPSRASLRENRAVGSTPFLTWTQDMLISTDSSDVPNEPECDILALYAYERQGILYIRVKLRGEEIDTEGRYFCYIIYLTSPEWGNVGYKLTLDKRAMWKCVDWEAIETFPTEWRVYDGATEVAIPLELLPSFTRLRIGVETRLFPDITLDYVEGTIEH